MSRKRKTRRGKRHVKRGGGGRGKGREEHTAIKTKKGGKKKREPTNADSKHVLKRPTSRAHMFILLASDKARVPSFQSLQARLQASNVYMCIVRSTKKKKRENDIYEEAKPYEEELDMLQLMAPPLLARQNKTAITKKRGEDRLY